MKTLQAILVLVAVCALGLPCVHGEAHHHHDDAAVALSGTPLCSACHVLSAEHCPKPHQVVTFMPASPVMPPDVQIQPFAFPQRMHIVPVVKARQSEALQFLHTVQLLI
jgi:hypothetical protein